MAAPFVSPDDDLRFEDHVVFQVPSDLASVVQTMVDAQDFSGLSFSMDDDGRTGTCEIAGQALSVSLVDLPRMIETYKTVDHFNIYKSADISQMLVVHPKGTNASLDYESGITPPTTRIRMDTRNKLLSKYSKEDIEWAEAEVLKLIQSGPNETIEFSLVDDTQPIDVGRENEICVDDSSDNENENEDDLISDMGSSGEIQRAAVEQPLIEIDGETQASLDSINRLLADDPPEPTQAEANLINEMLNQDDVDVVSVPNEGEARQTLVPNQNDKESQEAVLDFLSNTEPSQEKDAQPETSSIIADAQVKEDETMAENAIEIAEVVFDSRVVELRASLVPIQAEVDELKSSADALEAQIMAISNPIMKNRQQKRLDEIKSKLASKLEEVATIEAEIQGIINSAP